jgi:pyridoxal phosphate enzyme (YggS family)
MASIAENLAQVQDSVAAACRQAGRSRDEVELMAVSKTHPLDYLLQAAAAGQTLFGENRVQEFSSKSAALAAATASAAPSCAVELGAISPPAGTPGVQSLRVHLIGHLQANKAALAAEVFTSIDTVDSLRLAERLNQAAARNARLLPILVEIKLSHEPSKEGLAPESAELGALLERLPDLTSLAPRGLMTVAPLDEDRGVARACFRKLRQLRDTLAQRHPRLEFEVLSMGMSGDFAEAIEEGSTQVRIGTAIFGARPRPA